MNATPQQTRDLAHFLHLLYGTQAGNMEICYSDGPPDAKPKPKVRRIGWFAYPSDAERIIDTILTASQTHDVYVSLTLYSRRTRSKARALPGRAVVVDDIKAGDFAFFIETSAGNCQGYYILDDYVTADVREDIGRRAAYALGADTSGWDVTQLVRPPFTQNTKRKCGPNRWLVRPHNERT